MYTANLDPNWVYLGEEIPEGIGIYYTPEEAIAATQEITGSSNQFYIKHKLENNIVTENYLVFTVTQAMLDDLRDSYIFLECGDEEDNDNYAECVNDYHGGTPGTYELSDNGTYSVEHDNLMRQTLITALGSSSCESDSSDNALRCNLSSSDRILISDYVVASLYSGDFILQIGDSAGITY